MKVVDYISVIVLPLVILIIIAEALKNRLSVFDSLFFILYMTNYYDKFLLMLLELKYVHPFDDRVHCN